MTTPSPKDLEPLITSSSGDNGNFKIWTSMRESSFQEWSDYNNTYGLSDIEAIFKEMEHSLFQTTKPIFSPRK